MPVLKSFSLRYIVIILAVLTSCSKGKDTTPGSGDNDGGEDNTDTSCMITAISQVNSGAGAESTLSAFYNSSYQVTKIIEYDSVNHTKNFEANLTYITPDSVSINSYQYLLLDGSKRVTRFVTKSDMSDPVHADDYVFAYTYNSNGFLAAKDLFINGSAKANFSTVYSYNNSQLTGCIMTAPSAGNLKVLESTLAYDNNTTVKNWIHTFPDAIEGYQYLTVLNFGKHVAYPLKKVITNIYDPASGKLIDTWTTDYSNFVINANGYILSGEATGDLQQGMAAFYGKTNFYYACH